MGRVTRKADVCLSTLGPKANPTNLVACVADASLDRSPIVGINGEAGFHRIHRETHQYRDILNLFQPVTKRNAAGLSPDGVSEVVRRAFAEVAAATSDSGDISPTPAAKGKRIRLRFDSPQFRLLLENTVTHRRNSHC